MNPNAEFDLIVYGATGYTGRLVAEHLARRYGVGGEVTCAMARRVETNRAGGRLRRGPPEGDAGRGRVHGRHSWRRPARRMKSLTREGSPADQ